jgi:hypothetical protein
VTDIPDLTTLLVERAVNGPDTLAAHAVNAPVAPVLRCPTVAQLTPADGTYEHTIGTQAALTNVEYWDEVANAFTADRSICLNGHDLAGGVRSPGFDETCASISEVVVPECGWSYYRGTVTITTPGDGRLRNVSTSTRLFIRGGYN